MSSHYSYTLLIRSHLEQRIAARLLMRAISIIGIFTSTQTPVYPVNREQGRY